MGPSCFAGCPLVRDSAASPRGLRFLNQVRLALALLARRQDFCEGLACSWEDPWFAAPSLQNVQGLGRF